MFIFIKFLRVTFHLQLLWSIDSVFCIVFPHPWIHPTSLYSHILEPVLYPVVGTFYFLTLMLPHPLPTDDYLFVLHIHESIPSLVYSPVCCILYIPHISDVIQNLSFSLWLIPLSIMPSKSIHILQLVLFKPLEQQLSLVT